MRSRIMLFLENIKILQFPELSISGIIEMMILFFVIYKIVHAIRNTRAWVVFKGIVLILLFYLIADVLNFYVLTTIVKSLSGVALMSIVIIFNNDIRKIFEKLGQKDFKSLISQKNENELIMYVSKRSIEEIVQSVKSMSSTCTGALIVFEREVILDEYSETGISVKSEISKQMINNIFYDKTPLHDGAMIIKDNLIHVATSYLPLSNNPRIDKGLGTRHRAALGITEVSDAVVIVVSEETGTISYVKSGKIYRGISEEELRKKLLKDLTIRKEKKQFNLKEFITKNISDKFIAAALSFLVWFSYMNILSPPITKIVENVEFDVINEEVIEEKGITYDFNDNDYIDISLTGEASEVNAIKRSDIEAIVDLSKISISNAVEVNVSIPKYPNVEIKYPKGNIVNIQLDDLIDSEWEVNVNEIQPPNGNYVFDHIEFKNNINKIKISGAKNKVEKIGSVTLDLDLSRYKDGEFISKEITIKDKNGEIVNNNNFKIDRPVLSGKIKMVPSKQIPLNIEFSNVDEAPVMIKEIKYKPEYIYVAGEKNVLNDINELNITLDLSDLDTEKNSNKIIRNITLDEYLPDNIITPTNGNIVEINVDIEPIIEHKIQMTNEMIVSNMNLDEYVLKNPKEERDLVFRGPKSVLDKLNISSEYLYLDIEKVDKDEVLWLLKYRGDDRVELRSNIEIEGIKK